MERRNTINKKKIVKEFQNNHILNAKDLIAALPEIDPATIYRNLSKFIEDGLIREIHVKNGISSYELTEEHPHQHFICDGCDKILAVHVDLANIKADLPKSAKVNSVELNIRGLCSHCS
jgi:Fur family ferric uptake transcriptional regulator